VELQIDGITFNVVCKSNFVPSEKIPIIFLHGFTGNANDWLFLFDKINPKYFPIAIDLPGHGKSIVPNNLDYFSAKFHIKIITNLLTQFKIQKAVFVGYSMGGRAALSFAVQSPEKIIALILESATAGIENETERNSRIKTDYQLADKIISNGMELFVEYWLNLPFFASLKNLDNNIYSGIVANKKNNSPIGLSNSLKGFSTGIMPCLWNKLSLLKFPILLIAGSLDKKYVRINKKMDLLFPNSEMKIIENCGHNTHLEKEAEFVILVNNFLKNLN